MLLPPQQEDDETMHRRVLEGIENYFRVKVSREIRPANVYVIRIAKRRTRKAVEEASRQAMQSPEFLQAMELAQLTGLVAVSSSIDDLQRALENGLNRPVVDETGLNGLYDFKIRGEAHTTEAFLDMMREQVGLIVEPDRRNVETVVVRQR